MQNDRDLLRAVAVTRGWNEYRNESAQNVDPGEENFPAAPAGTRTRHLLITSLALYPLNYPRSLLQQQYFYNPVAYASRTIVISRSYRASKVHEHQGFFL